MSKCDEQRTKRAKLHQHHQNGLGMVPFNFQMPQKILILICIIFYSLRHSLLSTNRDSTYRDDDPKSIDDFNSNGIKLHKIEKSSSCSSFLFDVLFRGIVKFHLNMV